MTEDIEARLHAALDELTAAAPLRHPDGPRAVAGGVRPTALPDGSAGPGVPDQPPVDERRRTAWNDPKVLAMVACLLVLLGTVGLVGLSHAHRHHRPTTVATSTTVPPATTVPPTTLPPPTTTVPCHTVPMSALPVCSPQEAPATTTLPISVQTDAQMQAAGNSGPTSSVLVPSSCVVSGETVTATGTYQGGFAPNVYNRYGDVVVLYVLGAPTSGYSQGVQLGVSSVTSSPAMGSGTWQVSTTFDGATGTPAKCVVAAQPTHQVQLAP